MENDLDHRGSRISRLAFLLLAGAVLVAATVAVTWRVGLQRTARPPVAAVASGATTATSSAAAGAAVSQPPPITATSLEVPGACPAGPTDAGVPIAVPLDLRWSTGAYEPLPYSPTYGPLRQSAVGLPECFAHSPMGAVIAAWTINASLFSTSWRQTLDTQVAHTAGYPRLLTQLQATPPDGTPGVDDPAGFSVLAATPDAVTVDLVLRGRADGGLVGCPLTVTWDGSDWELAPGPDGTLTATPCPAADPGTFISWGP